MGAPEDVLGRVRDLLATDKVDLLEKSGHVLYSSPQTLKPGRAYFLGAYPAGDPDDPTAGYAPIRESIDESLRCTDPSFNRYICEDWGSGRGEAPIQRGAKRLFEALELELPDTCCSSVSFFRQKSSRSLSREEREMEELEWQVFADKSWPGHLEILKCVQPRLIIAYHSWPRKFLADRLDVSPGADSPHRMAPKRSFHCLEATVPGADISTCVLSLPCLSLGWLDEPGAAAALTWLKQKVKEHG